MANCNVSFIDGTQIVTRLALLIGCEVLRKASTDPSITQFEIPESEETARYMRLAISELKSAAIDVSGMAGSGEKHALEWLRQRYHVT